MRFEEILLCPGAGGAGSGGDGGGGLSSLMTAFEHLINPLFDMKSEHASLSSSS
jgi:hypothetical protein